MLISPRQLLDRLRHPRSRADELSSLRARFGALPSRKEASPELGASADTLRRLRVELSAALRGVEACHGCARGRSEPHGHWDGGHCCGGQTLTLWSLEECAALKLAGTRVNALEPPRADHAGCAFRGEHGCSLTPADRPSICVRYICLELRAELRDRDDWAAIARLAEELSREQARFAELLR